MDYFDLLDAIHQTVVPRSYLEIGVASGKSLSLVLPGTQTIGVDPAAKIQHPVSGQLHIFRQTSEEFFASNAAKSVLQGMPIDLTFIDGLHHAEAVLNDFRNVEALSGENSIILIHDCIPPNAISAERTRVTKIWVGDVWKAIVALKHHRPDLVITVVDVEPTGLAIVTGLNPASAVLFDDFYQVIDELGQLRPPKGDHAWKGLVGAVPFEWPAIRAQLPAQRFRAYPPDALVAQRRRRQPTLPWVTWRLRRRLRHSVLGRLRRQPADRSDWRGRGA